MAENTSLIDIQSPFNNVSNLAVTKSTSESITSNEEFMFEVADEVNDRQKRRKSIVIHNIAENDDEIEDDKQVIKILNKLVGDINEVEE